MVRYSMLVETALAVTLAASGNVAFCAWRPNATFPVAGEEKLVELPTFESPIEFNEAIVSWNVAPAAGAVVEIEARPGGSANRWYKVAEWQLDDASERHSLPDQKDSVAKMDTDTLVLKRPTHTLDVRLRLRRTGTGPDPVLRLVTVSVSNTTKNAPSSSTPSAAWGKLIEVPQRAQGNYPNGGVLCSATSLSMLLWHYSRELGQPEMNKDVPEVEANVWDGVYDGAGNWIFNAAYAGSFPQLTAYVARFRGIQDLEAWIAAGIPVICSVSLDILLERDPPRPSGHLVVLVGFEKNGDPIFNDPAKRDQVRRTYRRAAFEKSWLRSNRTVYLVYPNGAKVPQLADSPWMVRE